MKQIKGFNEYLNEGIRDKMTPKSKEDIKNSLMQMPIKDFWENYSSKNIKDILSETELNTLMDKLKELEKAEKDIQHGAQKNDVELIKNALKNPDLDINFKPTDIKYMGHIMTPLITACYYGSVDALKYLIDKGADINARTGRDYNQTALTIAVRQNQLEIVKTLVEYGVDINAKDHFGKTAKRIAMEYDHNEITQYLNELLSDTDLIKEIKRLSNDRDSFVTDMANIVYNHVDKSIPPIDDKRELIRVLLDSIGDEHLVDAFKKTIKYYNEKV